MSANAGREPWEDMVELKESRLLISQKDWEELRERQRQQIEWLKKQEQDAQRTREEQARVIAEPCSRCKTTGTWKVGTTKMCRRCTEVMVNAAIIEECGGMQQTAEQLAEQLQAKEYALLPEDECRW